MPAYADSCTNAAWERKQCEDLWEDIREGMRTKTPHFLGTVVLMSQDELRRDREGRSLRVFQLVDGQQRATTLCLLLLAVYDRVRPDHDLIARGYCQVKWNSRVLEAKSVVGRT